MMEKKMPKECDSNEKKIRKSTRKTIKGINGEHNF